MSASKIISDPAVKAVFDNYPNQLKESLKYLRNLILETAEELDEITELQETLKWGQPSYITQIGSTIRLGHPKESNDYRIYFKCTSKLVPSFKTAFGDLFNYENNRAIIFTLEDKVPAVELKKCIAAGLQYHKVKKLTVLGL